MSTKEITLLAPEEQPMSYQKAKEYKIGSENALKIDHLKIVFEEKTQYETLILKDVNLTFQKNKIYFSVGDSGSGKTTLVTHFNGLLKSKYGNLFVSNAKIYGAKKRIPNFKKLRKTVGMVFQFPEYQLFKDTILKDVMFGPVNLVVKKAESKKIAERCLLQMGIPSNYINRSPFDLSGGQKRRVAIAGILSIDPEILVFDEPTAGLDPSGTNDMLNLIQKLKGEGKTIFVITHDMNHALAIGDEVVVLDKQNIRIKGEPYKVFTDQELLSTTTLIAPRIIQTINKLCKIDERFNDLYSLKPRTIEELGSYIVKILGK